jgi:hypothetical protein
MAIHGDLIPRWGATPEPLAALGAALWRGCHRATAGAGVYPLEERPAAPLPARGRTGKTGDFRPWSFDWRKRRGRLSASMHRDIILQWNTGPD